jgi:hypothetical protein
MKTEQGFTLQPGAVQDITDTWEFIVEEVRSLVRFWYGRSVGREQDNGGVPPPGTVRQKRREATLKRLPKRCNNRTRMPQPTRHTRGETR